MRREAVIHTVFEELLRELVNHRLLLCQTLNTSQHDVTTRYYTVFEELLRELVNHRLILSQAVDKHHVTSLQGT